MKVLKDYFHARNNNILKARLRGYHKLKATNSIGLLRKVNESLTDCCFSEVGHFSSKHILGSGIYSAEQIVKQIMLQRHAGLHLNNALLFSLGTGTEVAYPMPKKWRDILSDHGFQINYCRCLLLWIGLVVLYYGYGILCIGRFALNSFFSIFNKRAVVKEKHAYFENLTNSNLPQPDKAGLSHDIISWYSKWDGRVNDLSNICHGVRNAIPIVAGNIRVEYKAPPFNSVNSFRSLIKFVCWSVTAIAIAFIDLLRGRWWHALLLAESAKAKVVQLSEPEALASDYLFHYSGTIYRPMWTYEAEKKGSRIICYFYSTSEQVKLPSGYESQRYEWGAASWPVYLVWDNYQADVIRRDIDENADIIVVGPIWFSTSSIELPDIPERSIAVFDIQPHRQSSYFGFITLADYHAQFPKLHVNFLTDIHSILSENKVSMVFKRKREIDKKSSVKKYTRVVQTLSLSKDVIIIDPSVSPVKVIGKCKGVISMPFTSTALYLCEQGIPSAYYDPTGWIQKDDRGAHGIPILSGIDELRIWVESVFNDGSL